jgi:hypothetical protein
VWHVRWLPDRHARTGSRLTLEASDVDVVKGTARIAVQIEIAHDKNAVIPLINARGVDARQMIIANAPVYKIRRHILIAAFGWHRIRIAAVSN